MNGATLIVSADDGTVPLRPGETLSEVFAQRRELELHSYYDQIRPHSFDTTFVPVSVEAARAWRVDNRGGELSAPYAEQLAKLKSTLAEHIDRATSTGGRAFVRLSTRSPKDAIDKSPALRMRLVQALRGRLHARSDENAQLCALQDCFGELMSVRDVGEALDLVRHSSRCVSDLVRMLDHLEHLPSWDLHVIVRQYVRLPAASEFRCFVHQRKLTAISQYFASCYYLDVHAGKHVYEARIAAFFEEHCVRAISLESYVLDVSVLPDKIWIIELNPWAHTTGGCLFDWTADEHVLHCGPLQTRVVTAPLPHLDALLLPYKEILAEARGVPKPVPKAVPPRSIKAVFVGDDTVGKFDLVYVLDRYAGGALTAGCRFEFPEYGLHKSECRIADPFGFAFTTPDGCQASVCLWHTHGQPEYDRLRPLSYPQTDVFVLAFSIVDRASFEHVRTKWMPEVRPSAGAATRFVLVGTKRDLCAARTVTVAEGEALRRELRADDYIETSAHFQEGLHALQAVLAQGAAQQEVHVRGGRNKRCAVS